MTLPMLLSSALFKGGVIIKGFKVDENGDVVIKNNKIERATGKELLVQTIKQVLGTNKGEWFNNPEEGITFQNVLGKNKTEDMIKYEVQQGLQQVDETFVLLSFKLVHLSDRKYEVQAKAQNSTGAEVSVTTTYG